MGNHAWRRFGRMSSGRTILRQAGLSRIVPFAVWVFCVLATGDAIVEGTAEFAIHTFLVLGAVALATWIVLWSPHLAVDAEGVTIVNPTVTVRVPFGALVEVRVGGLASVVARFAGGRQRAVSSWNAPGVHRRRPPRRVGSIGGSGAAGMMTYSGGRSDPRSFAESNPRTKVSAVVIAIDGFRTPWEQKHPEGDPGAVATKTLRWREWLVLTGLILINVAIRLR